MGSPSGFGGAASFSVFKLWVQEGTVCSALPKACPRRVAKSFLHVGDVVVRRQDTSRTWVHLVEPFVGDMRVAQVFDPRTLLPSSFGEECALQTLSRARSVNRESCAWSCGAPSRLFRGGTEVNSESFIIIIILKC